jgi:Mor family transcriptional regulator
MNYERNKQIKADRQKGLTYTKLSKKYNLCEKSIENILLDK